MTVRLQAVYYALTGIWPMVHYRSFELVSGPKREPWLVKTVGALTAVIAGTIAADPMLETVGGRRLAMGAATAYLAVDVWYAGIRRRISPIYLLDAAVEATLLGLHARSLATHRPAAHPDARSLPVDRGV